MSEHHGKIWWNELMTRDVAAAKAYYEATCGWEIVAMPMPFGDYWVCSHKGTPIAGIMDMDLAGDSMKGVPPHWFTYMAVSDVDAAVEATVAAGGTSMGPAFDVPEVGRIGIVKDPSGAPMGLMTPAESS